MSPQTQAHTDTKKENTHTHTHTQYYAVRACTYLEMHSKTTAFYVLYNIHHFGLAMRGIRKFRGGKSGCERVHVLKSACCTIRA